MNRTNKILLHFANVYIHEAMAQDIPASGDITQNDILSALFSDIGEAEKLYIEGKNLSQGDKAKVKKLFLDLDSRKWSHDKQGLSLFNLAVLMDDWKFVNTFNIFERADRATGTNAG